MSEILPGMVCGAMAIGAVVLWAFFLTSRIRSFSPFDDSYMNLRIWASGAGVRLASFRMRGRTKDRATYQFLVDAEDGRKRAGWATVGAIGLDVRSERVEIVWEREAPSMRSPRHHRDDPLWDDGLDGLPGA